MVEEFKIRLAAIEDMKAVFDLSNDELVRKNSFSQGKIEWENHKNWYEQKINSENCVFYLIKNYKNDLIAQVRFDINSNEADISISISPEFRGQGFGEKILRATTQKVVSENKIKKINAYVKNENSASKKIFERTGYILKEETPEKARYEYNAK